jgi:hypothetical protein
MGEGSAGPRLSQGDYAAENGVTPLIRFGTAGTGMARRGDGKKG